MYGRGVIEGTENFSKCLFLNFHLFVGLQDYQAALKIDPDNEQLKRDEENIRQIVQSSEG